MIQVVFSLGGDNITVEIDGTNLMFCDTNTMQTSPIEGLKLSKVGVIKEFPDLEDDDEWKSKAIERFKSHFSKLKTQQERVEYIISDLKKFGYTPLYKRRAGFRPEKIK